MGLTDGVIKIYNKDGVHVEYDFAFFARQHVPIIHPDSRQLVHGAGKYGFWKPIGYVGRTRNGGWGEPIYSVVHVERVPVRNRGVYAGDKTISERVAEEVRVFRLAGVKNIDIERQERELLYDELERAGRHEAYEMERCLGYITDDEIESHFPENFARLTGWKSPQGKRTFQDFAWHMM
ncbi:MAG: hypothetical protein HYW22_01480 [Candidatus Aenigmarchaeota archaeon]|nr:hypothetical protein [Candidatus Aenigmarchaeota archaeon]